MRRAISVVILFAIVSPAIAGAKSEAIARCAAIHDGIHRRDCFRSLKVKTTTTAADPSLQQFPTGEEPETTSAINHPNAPTEHPSASVADHAGAWGGQPLCVDREALAAMLMADLLASTPASVVTKGCRTIPEDAKVEVIERYPSGFHFLTAVNVKVTAPSLPDAAVGYTIDVAP